MKTITVALEDIYIPVKLAQSADPAKVEATAEAYIENGRVTPIRVRHDGKRYVLVNGVHRVAAFKALGETEIPAFLVQAIQH